MLQRGSLPTSVTTEITGSIQQTFSRRRLEIMQEMLWLPETYQQYLLLLLGVLTIGAGLLVHVWLTVQIAQEQLLVSELTAQRQQIERENSEVIFAIANSSTLDRVEEAALQQGFRPATDRVYVRRDAVASDVTSGLADAPPTSLPAVIQPPGRSTRNTGPEQGFIDAVGRGLGAAGAWVQQATQTTAQAVGGFATGFTERWMP